MKKTISQSDLKSWINYKQDKECGILTHAKLFGGLKTEPSESQQLGIWFEYQCTGALPKSGDRPETPKLKSGGIPVAYQRMEAQVERYNKIMKSYGFIMLEAGKYLEHGVLHGTVDIVAEKDGKICFIDLKTSGLLNDKWSDFGWAEERIEEKTGHAMQVIHYKALGILEYGYEPDFYFFVFSNTNDYDSTIYKAEVDAERMENHIILSKQVLNDMHSEKEWKPIPSVANCNECPLKSECKKFTDIPTIKPIYFK